MFEILKEFAVKALGRVLPFLVGWYYKPDKLAKKIKIRSAEPETVLFLIVANYRTSGLG